jgi:hypothetical protein
MRFSCLITVVALWLAGLLPAVAQQPAAPVEPPPAQTPSAAAPPGPAPSAPTPAGPATPAPASPSPVPKPEAGRIVPFEFSAPGGGTIVTTEEGRVVTFRGPVRVTYGDYVITSDAAIYREAPGIAEFTGNVTLRSPEQTVTGDAMSLNLHTREWRVRRGRTELTPELLQQGTLSSIYVRSTQIAGAPGAVELGESAATTCDLPNPHYEIRAREILVYPGDRLVAKGAALYVFGRRMFSLANLVVPLRDYYRRGTLLPQVGQSDSEGYFLKYARPYRAGGNNGLLHLDLLSKRGIGTGIDQAYRLFGGAGSLLLYNVLPKAGVPQETSGRLQHRQQWGNLTGTFETDYRRSSYTYAVAPNTETTSLNTDINLLRQEPGGPTTSLGLHMNRDSSGTSFSNLSTNFSHSQQFTPTLAGEFGIDYLASHFTGGDTGQLNSRMEMRRRAGALDLTLAANDSTQFGDQTGGFFGIERLPELTLSTDTFRFQHGRLADSFPARLSLSLGQFHEGQGLTDTNQPRALIDFNIQNKEWDWGDSSFRLNAGFRQAFYGDGGAQYVISGNPSIDWALGRESSMVFSYTYQNPAGYTPFRFDFPYRQNRVESTLDLRRGDRLGLGIRTGYDFDADPRFRWQNVTLHARWMPTPNALFTLATSYNPNPLDLPQGSTFSQAHLQTVIGELRIRVPNGLRLDLGARYDPARSGFPAAKGQIDTALGSKWHLTALVGYDGFTRFNDFMLVRDLHCWELALVRVDHRDWRREQSWMLMLRIKAFPPLERFGLGQSGQAIDTSVGDVF